jgi:hypothetical protein
VATGLGGSRLASFFEEAAMTQAQLNCAVSRRTGESICTVRHRGFSLLTQDRNDLEPEEVVLSLDCPFCGRQVAYPGATDLAECDRCDLEFNFQPDDVYAASAGVVAQSRDVVESSSVA